MKARTTQPIRGERAPLVPSVAPSTPAPSSPTTAGATFWTVQYRIRGHWLPWGTYLYEPIAAAVVSRLEHEGKSARIIHQSEGSI